MGNEASAVEAAIQKKYGRVFAACEQVLTKAGAIEQQNKGRFQVNLDRPSTGAVARLYAKAMKSYQAVICLSARGFGEDAVVLARSLTNLCIDMGYICHKDSDERAKDWIAVGEEARPAMADVTGTQLPEEKSVDWKDAKTRANRWKGLGIRGRAEVSENKIAYDYAYRHGSTFEHSDSWSTLSYAKWGDEEVDLQVDPSDAFVWHALILATHAFTKIILYWGGFFGMELGDSEKTFANLLDSHFRVKGDPDKATAPDLA